MNVSETLCAIVSGTNFRGTLRWLHRSNPELWAEVLQLTSFLPDTASAPQRVWHVVNNINQIPTCPVTKKQLKWADYNRGYCVTINRSSKMMMQHERGDFAHTFTDEINQKRSAGNKRAVERGRKYRDKSTYTEESLAKAKATCITKYGVDNYSKSSEMRELAAKLVYERYLANGGIPREQRGARRQYYDAVAYYTNESWVKYFDKINPTRIERGPQHHLDHIYSRAEGYKNSIDPKIIGHWTNLRIIPFKRNSSKRDRCDKTLEQLMEDYHREIIANEQSALDNHVCTA